MPFAILFIFPSLKFVLCLWINMVVIVFSWKPAANIEMCIFRICRRLTIHLSVVLTWCWWFWFHIACILKEWTGISFEIVQSTMNFRDAPKFLEWYKKNSTNFYSRHSRYHCVACAFSYCAIFIAGIMVGYCDNIRGHQNKQQQQQQKFAQNTQTNRIKWMQIGYYPCINRSFCLENSMQIECMLI